MTFGLLLLCIIQKLYQSRIQGIGMGAAESHTATNKMYKKWR